MRKKLVDMIGQKLLRLDAYKTNYSIGKVFGLIVEVEDFCQIYSNFAKAPKDIIVASDEKTIRSTVRGLFFYILGK